MANNNTKAKRRLDRMAKNYFHGRACDTGHGAPGNKRRSPHDYGSVKRNSGEIDIPLLWCLAGVIFVLLVWLSYLIDSSVSR